MVERRGRARLFCGVAIVSVSVGDEEIVSESLSL